MFRFVMIAASVLGLMTAPVAAGSQTLDAPLQAAMLKDGALDMVTYYRDLDGDVMEVTATFAERSGFYKPTRVVLGLMPDSGVAFSVPGYPEALYRMKRIGDTLEVSVRMIEFVDVAQID